MTVETSIPVNSQFGELLGVWVDSFRSVLSQVAGFPVSVDPSTDQDFADGEISKEKPGVWMRFTAAKALHGEMAILTSEVGAIPLAQILMSESPNPAAPFDQGRREAYEEFLRQVVGMVSTGLKGSAGGDVEIKHSSSESPSWTNASRAGIRIAGEKISPIHLVLVVTAELVGSFKPAEKIDPPPASNTEQSSVPQTNALETRTSNLELLLDVALDATIRFGQKQMLLREVLELHPGVAVTLDRRVEEPVELLIGGRMVALGEVVIVDGNYGLRITEILSPQQRIESLRPRS